MKKEKIIGKLKDLDMIDERAMFAFGNSNITPKMSSWGGAIGALASGMANQTRDLRFPKSICVAIKGNKINFIRLSAMYGLREFLFSLDFENILIDYEHMKFSSYAVYFAVENKEEKFEFVIEAPGSYIKILSEFVAKAKLL